MKTLVSCAYNMDNCCVELKFTDGEYSVLPEPGVRRVRATVPGSERRYIFRCCCASPPRELSMAAGSVVHGRHAFYMPVLTNI